MTGESLKPILPRNHTAPSGRRLSEQTGSPNLLHCIVQFDLIRPTSLAHSFNT